MTFIARLGNIMIGAALFAGTAPVYALSVAGVPTVWKLENYVGGAGVVIWNTSSPCAGQTLQLPANATADDKNRLYTLIVTAKTASVPVEVQYSVSASGECLISSFSLLAT